MPAGHMTSVSHHELYKWGKAAVELTLRYPLLLSPLTRSEVWLKLQGADLSSVGFSTVRAVSARLWKKTTHGGNYGIMLRQECSHDGQWDLMEVPVAALRGLWVI